MLLGHNLALLFVYTRTIRT